MKLLFILLVFGLILLSGCTEQQAPASNQVPETQINQQYGLLTLGQLNGKNEVEVFINTDKAVSLQFDVAYKNLDFENFILESRIDKQATYNSVSVTSTRIMIAGLNTNTIPKGKLGTLKFTKRFGEPEIRLSEVMGVDEDANEL